jgi:hypothetical protein
VSSVAMSSSRKRELKGVRKERDEVDMWSYM